MRMTTPVLFGAAYSVYTRIARLALHEKGVAHRFQEIDIFSPAGIPANYAERHPFGKIPAFEHLGFRLFETASIARYVDEAFDGPSLQPVDAPGRARVAQIIGLLDSYAYRAMVWDVFVERVRKPTRGDAPDETKIAGGLERADICLRTLDGFMADAGWLAGRGERPTLADLHAAPMVLCLRQAPEGAALLARFPRLAAWLDRMIRRESLRATPSPMFSDSA